MATNQIRMDYDATLQASRQLQSVSDLVRDAQARQGGVTGDLMSWEGAAATRGKEVLAKLDEVLASYDDAYKQFAAFFVAAAEQFSTADEAAARSMSSEWNGAYGAGQSQP